MLKILQARLQQYMNRELPDVQAGFRKGRGIRDQIANIRWIMEKSREFQKNIYFCFIDYAKAFDCVDHNKLWKIIQEIEIPDHLTCLLRNLYAHLQPYDCKCGVGMRAPGRQVQVLLESGEDDRCRANSCFPFWSLCNPAPAPDE